MKNLFCFLISFASLNCAAMEMNSEEHIAFVSCKGARILKDKIFMLAQAITMQRRGPAITLEGCDILQPENNQTKEGIFLEWHYDAPAAIYTPYGRWQFVYKTSILNDGDKALLQEIIAKAGAKEYERRKRALGTSSDGQTIHAGCDKIIYCISKIDDMILPEPRFKDKDDYIHAPEARKIWQQMRARHESEGKTT